MPDGKSKKPIELKLVEEGDDSEEVVRLDRSGAQPVDRLPVDPLPEAPERLVHEGDAAFGREHEPDIDSILEGQIMAQDLESDWADPESGGPVPHGWFVLIFVLMATVVLVSVFFLTRPEDERTAEIAKSAALENIVESDEAEKAAISLVDRIQTSVVQFASAKKPDDLLAVIRDVDRVGPMVTDWYERNPFRIPALSFFGGVSPVMKRDGIEIWRAEYVGENEVKHPLLVEVPEEGPVKVDWETFVCYQPMAWPEFVSKRPEDQPMQFRVYAEPDLGGLFTFEFRDEEKWRGYQLSTRESQDYLFGYVERGSELDQTLLGMIRANQGTKVAVVLTLRVPQDARSRRGVYIDELVSDNWIIIDPR